MNPLPHDPKLVVTDMDGTLLDANGRIPDMLWALLSELEDRGITFAVASGRQLAALSGLFSKHLRDVVFIAENGAYVVRNGKELSSNTLNLAHAERVVRTVRRISKAHDIGLVWCGRETAYIERSDSAFVREAGRFYSSLEVIEDLIRLREPPLKLAAFDFDGTTSGSMRIIARASRPYKVVASSGHWMDIMDPGVHKGVAVRSLMSTLDATPDQTIIFGDYLNDLEMLGESTYSYAMANAHPEVLKRARFVAPTNVEQGVMTTLASLLAATRES